MAALSVQVPYPVFYDRDGQPLDNGNIYIGAANLDPVTNPIQVYYDDALTIPASQPLKTSNGYIYRNGTPAQLYVNAVNFSILVKDEKNLLVYSFPDGTGISPNASGVIYNQGSAGAVDRTVENRLQDYVSVKDFGAVGDGITNDTAAIQAAVDAASRVYIPAGNYAISIVSLNTNNTLFGDGDASVLVSLNTTYSVSDDAENGLLNTKNISNVTLSNFKVDTNNNRPTLKIILSSNVTIENVSMNGLLGTGQVFGYAIHLAGSTDVYVDSCRLADFYNGVYMSRSSLATGTDCGNVYVRNCKIWQDNHGTTRQYPTGVYGYYVENMVVSNCYFANIKPSLAGSGFAGYGVYEGDGDAVSVIVENCQFIDDDGVVTDETFGISTSLSDIVKISDCYFNGLTSHGVRVRGLQIAVADCFVTGGMTTGILVGGRTGTLPTEWSVTDCIITDTSEYGILVGDSNALEVNNAIVCGNTVKRAGRAGIFIREATQATVTSNQVVDCNLTNQVALPDNCGIVFFGSRSGLVSANFVENRSGVGLLDYGIGCSTATNTLIVTPDNMIVNMDTAPTINLLAAAPTTGTWSAGTKIHFWSPAAGGPEGVVCVTSGSPGTWQPYGLVGEAITVRPLTSFQQATSSINDPASANAVFKYQGKVAFDSTNNRLMVAAGPNPTDAWWVADGSASVVPV